MIFFLVWLVVFGVASATLVVFVWGLVRDAVRRALGVTPAAGEIVFDQVKRG